MTPRELRQIRQALGWSQETVASRLGVSLRAYRYYEAGTRPSSALDGPIPQPIAVAMLAHRFAQEVTELASASDAVEEDIDDDDDEDIEGF